MTERELSFIPKTGIYRNEDREVREILEFPSGLSDNLVFVSPEIIKHAKYVGRNEPPEEYGFEEFGYVIRLNIRIKIDQELLGPFHIYLFFGYYIIPMGYKRARETDAPRLDFYDFYVFDNQERGLYIGAHSDEQIIRIIRDDLYEKGVNSGYPSYLTQESDINNLLATRDEVLLEER